MWDGLCQPQTWAALSSGLTHFNQNMSAAELNNQPAYWVGGPEQPQVSPGLSKGPCLAAECPACQLQWLDPPLTPMSGFLLPSMSTAVMLENGKGHLGPLDAQAIPRLSCAISSAFSQQWHFIALELNKFFCSEIVGFFSPVSERSGCLLNSKANQNCCLLFIKFLFLSMNIAIVLIWLPKCIHLIMKA